MKLTVCGPVDLGRQVSKMKIIFVRHSEPDYSMLDDVDNTKDYRGFGRDLAPLTKRGRDLAQEMAKRDVLKQADIIISSSITRALEKATYIARETRLDLLVEPFFHEWRPDLDGLNYTAEAVRCSHQLFWENNGLLASDSPYRYETAEQVRTRFLRALEKYKTYKTVVIVTHGMLMRQFVSQEKIDFCDIIEYELDM